MVAVGRGRVERGRHKEGGGVGGGREGGEQKERLKPLPCSTARAGQYVFVVIGMVAGSLGVRTGAGGGHMDGRCVESRGVCLGACESASPVLWGHDTSGRCSWCRLVQRAGQGSPLVQGRWAETLCVLELGWSPSTLAPKAGLERRVYAGLH